MKLTLSPCPLMRAFHAPKVVVDCGETEDIEATACAAYLLWQVEYPEYTATITIPGRPVETHRLNCALFATPPQQGDSRHD